MSSQILAGVEFVRGREVRVVLLPLGPGLSKLNAVGSIQRDGVLSRVG